MSAASAGSERTESVLSSGKCAWRHPPQMRVPQGHGAAAASAASRHTRQKASFSPSAPRHAASLSQSDVRRAFALWSEDSNRPTRGR